MFKIQDGRENFYQWDLDRKLIVEDGGITQVHFCNRTDECSLVCEVYDDNGLRLVDVPNVLLQDIWRINVYGYDVNYTKHSARFDVYPRSKPDNYVYTETETLNYNTLLGRIDEVDENMVRAIEEYLEANPPEVDLGGYATIAYVDETVSNVDIPEVDLSGYYTKTEVDALIPEEVDLSGYALKEEIPSLEGYAKTEDIPDVSGYATKADIPDVSAFQTEEEVTALIDAALAEIVDGEAVSY